MWFDFILELIGGALELVFKGHGRKKRKSLRHRTKRRKSLSGGDSIIDALTDL